MKLTALIVTTTGGLANPVVAVAETGAGLVLTLLSLLLPALALVLVVLLGFWLLRLYRRRQQQPI